MIIAIIGLGSFGYKLAQTLYRFGAEVIAIDNDMKVVESIKDEVTSAASCDSTDEEALREAGVGEADIAVVAVGEDIKSCILTTAILKKMGIKRIISRAVSPIEAEILKNIGADEVLLLEEEMGELYARKILSPVVHRYIPLLTGRNLVEMEITEKLAGKTLKELHLRADFGINVITIKHKVKIINDNGETEIKEVINDIPGPNEQLNAGDILIIAGKEENLDRFFKRFS